MREDLRLMGSGWVHETEHWRIFRIGNERILVMQFKAAAPGRLQKAGAIHTIDPHVPKVYTRFGTCFELHGPPDTDPLFFSKARQLLHAPAGLVAQIEDESDAIYSLWRQALQ